MIYGIGTDICEINRIKRACERETFLKRTFSDEERRQALGSFSKLAGDFAVKEAVAKAMGTGIVFSPTEIECLREKNGRPYVRITGEAERIINSASESLGESHTKKIHVSISNTDKVAIALAVLEFIRDDA